MSFFSLDFPSTIRYEYLLLSFGHITHSDIWNRGTHHLCTQTNKKQYKNGIVYESYGEKKKNVSL